ncbi:MAG: hypothetical protein BRC31_05030 [Actinobacteria bacterium QS_5_72_10]|nr:MAG: hypothetical protein BRC31_05030 [Actinobacteria bacterium QS_5_72_10]
MELAVRCSLPDRPGSLARVTSAVGEVGVDIEAVEVVDVADGRAIDDMVVVVDGATTALQVLDRLDSLEGVEVIQSGPSRCHPGDAVARVAVGLQALLEGSVDVERGATTGATTLVGGLLGADAAELTNDPPSSRHTRLVVALGERWLVLNRSYAFTDTERHRAEALSRVAAAAARAQAHTSVPP